MQAHTVSPDFRSPRAVLLPCHTCTLAPCDYTHAGVHDTVVNQLLTKIDGVDALNNILLIGMTNRCVVAHA